MDLAICSIQKNRAMWLPEWIAFHHLVGFEKFYIYLHACDDQSAETIEYLSRYFDITSFELSRDLQKPQLLAYHHCYKNYGNLHDWISFLDGDEFLFSPKEISIKNSLLNFSDDTVDALGVYWRCFGSSGHLMEPVGLITENYRYRANDSFHGNQHFKSLVRGGLGDNFSILNNSHFFGTLRGTSDTARRKLNHGKVNNMPDYDCLIINHYATQSREFFEKFKRHSGAADGDKNLIRSEDWWSDYDRNELYDSSTNHLKPDLLGILSKISYR